APAITTSSRRSRPAPAPWLAARRRCSRRPSRRTPNRTRREDAMGATGIGAAGRRKGDVRVITGPGHHTHQFPHPRRGHAVFIRWPHAQARIKAIDAAVTGPGVSVLTGADLAGDKIGHLICGWMIHSKDGSPMKMAPHPALAHQKVCHVGDPVAVVIADT